MCCQHISHYGVHEQKLSDVVVKNDVKNKSAKKMSKMQHGERQQIETK